MTPGQRVEAANVGPGCPKCGNIPCLCDVMRWHRAGCNYRLAALSPVGVECDHGYDVCPTCDPCDCVAPATGGKEDVK